MRKLTIKSSLIELKSARRLSPAMVATVWEIAAALDERRIRPGEDAVWLTLPSARLRGVVPGDTRKADNTWLRHCLQQLVTLQVSGVYHGDAWGAAVLAEWRMIRGGTQVRLLVPPAGIAALTSADTFVRIEAAAAHHLGGYARRLYLALSDKKRLGRSWWRYDLDELRSILGVEGLRAYRVWGQMRQRVLLPALAEIEAYGTVKIEMVPAKEGKRIVGVTFRWQWKDLREAAETDHENQRAKVARGKTQIDTSAPPLTDTVPETPAALSPREAAWKRIEALALDTYGPGIYNSWINRLSMEDHGAEGVILRGVTRFVGSRVATQFGEQLREWWDMEEPGVSVRFSHYNSFLAKEKA